MPLPSWARWWLAALALLVGAPFSAARAECTCSRARSAPEAYAGAPVVVVARVLDSRDGRRDAGDSLAPRVGRVVVTRVVKRLRVADTIEVVTPGGDCGVPFVAGEDLLLYARLRITKDDASGFGRVGRPSPKFGSDLCAGSKRVRCAAEDFEQLGETPPPEAGTCEAPRPSAAPPDAVHPHRAVARPAVHRGAFGAAA